MEDYLCGKYNIVDCISSFYSTATTPRTSTTCFNSEKKKLHNFVRGIDYSFAVGTQVISVLLYVYAFILHTACSEFNFEYRLIFYEKTNF